MKLSAEYLAGFFDGEGCVNFTVRGKNRQMIPRVMIVNTDSKIMNLIYKQFGGYLNIKEHKKHLNWKPSITITLKSTNMVKFLNYIRPYCILKKKQIELIFEFLKFKENGQEFDIELVPRKDNQNMVRQVRRRSKKTLKKEIQFKEKMHNLNQKGLILN